METCREMQSLILFFVYNDNNLNREKAGSTGFQPVLDSRGRLSYICLQTFRNGEMRGKGPAVGVGVKPAPTIILRFEEIIRRARLTRRKWCVNRTLR